MTDISIYPSVRLILEILGAGAIGAGIIEIYAAYEYKCSLDQFSKTLDQKFEEEPFETYKMAINFRDDAPFLSLFGINRKLAGTLEYLQRRIMGLAQAGYNREKLESFLMEESVVITRLC